MPLPPASTFAARLAFVRERVQSAARRAGRDADRVRILAVAKTAHAADLHEAWAAGQRQFAHNRVQALVRDAAALPAAEWHMIGPLQGNKVTDCLQAASLVQSVGEAKTAARLDRAAMTIGRRLPVFLQANLQPEDGRYGCPLETMEALAREVLDRAHLELRGLMTIAAPAASTGQLRADFSRLRSLAEAWAASGMLPPDPELSMGMSEDFEIAVEEGATLVRIGRFLFPPGAEGQRLD